MRCNYQLHTICPDCMHPAMDCVCDDLEYEEWIEQEIKNGLATRIEPNDAIIVEEELPF